MKILAITGLFLPSIGGYQLSTHQTLKELKGAGADITLVASNYKGDKKFDKKAEYKIIRKGNANYFGSIKQMLYANQLYNKGNFDLVLLLGHYPETSYGILFPFLSFTPTTLAAGTRLPFPAPFWKRYIGKKVLCKCYNDSSQIISISEQSKNLIQEYCNTPSDRFSFVPRPIDDKVFGKIQKKKGNEVFTIGTIGRLEKLKNIDEVLLLIMQLKKEGIDVHYKIAGTGDYESSINKKILDYGISENVSMLGDVDHDELPALYRNLDLFVLLSRRGYGESFGRVYAESFSQATPVIGYDTGAVSEVIDHGENGYLFSTGDLKGVKSAIINLINNPQKLKKLGENARKKYEKIYNSSVVGKKLFEILKITK